MHLRARHKISEPFPTPLVSDKSCQSKQKLNTGNLQGGIKSENINRGHMCIKSLLCAIIQCCVLLCRKVVKLPLVIQLTINRLNERQVESDYEFVQ